MINATEQLDLIEAELKSTYKRLGFTNSNVLEFIPQIKEELSEEAEHKRLCNFFLWVRNNGNKHFGKSIEEFVSIYLKQKK